MKTLFSRILKKIQRGKTSGETPVAKLTAIEPSPTHRPKVGTVTSAPVCYDSDAFDPMTDEELAEWGL